MANFLQFNHTNYVELNLVAAHTAIFLTRFSSFKKGVDEIFFSLNVQLKKKKRKLGVRAGIFKYLKTHIPNLKANHNGQPQISPCFLQEKTPITLWSNYMPCTLHP